MPPVRRTRDATSPELIGNEFKMFDRISPPVLILERFVDYEFA